MSFNQSPIELSSTDLQPLLDVRDLRVAFVSKEGAAQQAVKGVNFSVSRGEVLGIVGESGSGKSVTSMSILQLLPPAARIDGKLTLHRKGTPCNLLDLTHGEMAGIRGNEIGMIFQEPLTALNPVFKCGQQVMEVLKLHRDWRKEEMKAHVISLFEEVKLPRPEEIFNAYPHQLSGGQRQRVMIAMAVACEPDLLIADEPTTALDVTVQKRILSIIRDLSRKKGMGVIFITHDLGVVAELADRIAVMYRGELVEEGAVKDIFQSPKHHYTKGLLACRPPLDRQLDSLPTIADFTDPPEGESESYHDMVKRLALSPEDIAKRRKTLYDQEPLIRIEKLNTRFTTGRNFWGRPNRWYQALKDIDLEIYPGETIGLVGESGSGKTTLGRTLLHLVTAQSGGVFYKGHEISGISSREWKSLRREMQIIFQDPYSSLNPKQKVGEAIVEPMTVHGLHGNHAEREERAAELLEKVGLDRAAYHRYPHEFSGGQRQRVGIARVLAMDPSFIICDESVSALDVSVQAQVLNLLNELKKEFNFTYLFISHDLSVIRFISDRIVVMNQGQVEEVGYPDEMFAHPQKPYTRTLLEAVPEINPEWTSPS